MNNERYLPPEHLAECEARARRSIERGKRVIVRLLSEKVTFVTSFSALATAIPMDKKTLLTGWQELQREMVVVRLSENIGYCLASRRDGIERALNEMSGVITQHWDGRITAKGGRGLRRYVVDVVEHQRLSKEAAVPKKMIVLSKRSTYVSLFRDDPQNPSDEEPT